MTLKQRSICLRIVDNYGTENQKRKAVEELVELATELCHALDGREDREAVVEELADVIVMSEQLRIIYGQALVDSRVEDKLERMVERMSGIRERDNR